MSIYLTLTSVVFECEPVNAVKIESAKFNFNKCCIWML